MSIRQIIFDYDGVFTKDDYTKVIDAFEKSSGLDREEIETRIGQHEKEWVTSPAITPFLYALKEEFNFPGSINKISRLLSKRGYTGLYAEFPRFVNWKNRVPEGQRGLSILSSQLGYSSSRIKDILERNIGLKNFDRIWFSNEVGYCKAYVGVTEDTAAVVDMSGVDIFPMVADQLRYLGYEPSECVFIDDSQKNVNGWVAQGGCGIDFKNLEQMFVALKVFGVDLDH